MNGVSKPKEATKSAGFVGLSAGDLEHGLALRVSNLGVRMPKGRGASRLWGEHHWAFRGLNIEVKRGESIGILGRNGSGKSTLLRTIAGIIAANEGSIAIAPGLTAAILSPGAGFENNLTGRENLYNSALYQGFLPKVVAKKIDEIVEMSGIGEWVDQPVAIYSAGMRARLGLSLSLHLPSDVLMIDETLSAGDAAFRATAKKMIDSLIASDRTVLLVSHNLETLRTMCTKGIVLDQGRQVAACEIAEAIEISKSILLGSPESGELTPRERVQQQIEAVQNQLRAWEKQNAEHAGVFRTANHGYQVALEQAIQIADKLMAQQEAVASASGSGVEPGGVNVAPNVDAIVKSYRDAREKVRTKRAERDKVRAEQERITKIGNDLRERMAGLRGQLAGL